MRNSAWEFSAVLGAQWSHLMRSASGSKLTQFDINLIRKENKLWKLIYSENAFSMVQTLKRMI